MSGEYYLW